MKNYIIFIASFLLFFFITQWALGVLYTMVYTPNISEAWNRSGDLSQGIVIAKGSSNLITLLTAGVAATAAYFIPRAFKRFF